MTLDDERTSLIENTLDPKSAELHLSGLAQVTGVGLKDSSGRVEGRLDVTSQESLRGFVPDRHLPIIINSENRLLSLTGISALIKELRKHILELSVLDDKNLDINFDMSNDAIAIAPEHSKFLLSEKKSIINKYISSVARIQLLIRAIDSIAGDERDEYNLIKSQLKNWLAILNEILPNLNENNEINKLIEEEIDKQSQNNEVARLKNLLSGERAGSDEEKQKKLKTRVNSVLLGNTDVDKQNEVSKDLFQEVWEVSSVINDIRLIERYREEHIDLLDIKKQISALKNEFEEKKRQKGESQEMSADWINNRILSLVVPIVNATNKLFPHNSAESPSNIAAILYRNEALCAGKAEVISSIMRLIGLESTSIFVIQTNDNNHSSHRISKTKMFGGKILLADANYPSTKNSNGLIRWRATTLLYTAKRVAENNSPKNNVFKMVETNGEIVFFESDSDAPHKIIANQEQGSIKINQGNFASLLGENYQKLGLSKEEATKQANHHYQEALRINPNHSIAHNNFANLLMDNYQELGLSKEEAIKQANHHYQEALKNTNKLYYLWILTNYADFLLHFVGDTQSALFHYQEALQLMNDSPHLPSGSTKEEIEEKISTIT